MRHRNVVQVESRGPKGTEVVMTLSLRPTGYGLGKTRGNFGDKCRRVVPWTARTIVCGAAREASLAGSSLSTFL